MRKYLILINNAPRMGAYHTALGEYLEKEGNEVVYVFSDYFPIYKYNIDLKNKTYYVFADFFKENFNNRDIDPKYHDINIWKFYFSEYDRNIKYYKCLEHDDDYVEGLLANLVNFFDSIYKKHATELILNEVVANSFAYAAFEVGKIYNVQYCGYATCRLPQRFELYTEEFGSINRFKKRLETIDISELSEDRTVEIQQYLDKYTNIVPSYHPKKHPLAANSSILKRYFNKEKFNSVFCYFRILFQKHNTFKYAYQLGNPITYSIKQVGRQIKRKLRIIKGFKFDKPKAGDSYYLYPLHYKPESSTSVLARCFSDDLELLKNISFNLPFGTYLYVKEHFVNYANRPFSFYKELMKLPNVKLISYEENVHELIKNSISIITVTGTMGFEALFMRKRVLVFGNVFYQYHPNCLKCTNYDELYDILLQMKKDGDVETEASVHIKFLAAYLDCSYAGYIYYILYEQETYDLFIQDYLRGVNKFINEK